MILGVTQTKVARIGKRYPRALPAGQAPRTTGLAGRLLAWLVALVRRLGL